MTTFKTWDIIVAFKINTTEVELIGRVEPDPEADESQDDAIFDIQLTEQSKEHLSDNPLGNLRNTITSLFDQFNIGGEVDNFLELLRAQVEGVPPLKNLWNVLFETDIYLTDLAFRTNKSITVGIILEFGDQIGPVTFDRAGFKVTVDLSEEQPAD